MIKKTKHNPKQPMKKSKALLTGAAVAGLITGSMAVQVHAAQNGMAGTSLQKTYQNSSCSGKSGCKSHSCKGQNSCKGQGGCKSGNNGCKGKNSCKGKGGCATKTTKSSS